MSTFLSKIRLVNFRSFERAEMALHPELNVFLGDNGSGKTSILQGISILLSGIFPFCDYKPQMRALPYSVQNIRTWTEQTRGRNRRVFAEVSGCAAVLTEGEADVKNGGYPAYETFLSTAAKIDWNQDVSILRSKKEIAQRFNRWATSNEGIPVFAHYGPHRGAEQGDRRRFARRNVDYTNPFSAYLNALHPSLDFKSFLEWFSEEEANELREQRRNRSFLSNELETVRQALTLVFSTGEIKFSDPRFETNPKRFVMTATSADGAVAELQFDQLSDGYRGMIALVADFARRLALANQYADTDSLQGDGILIIDEIDAHLHPKWQFRVIDDLRRTFPNVQLIVTTHSPEVVSTVSKESVFILAPVNGIQKEEHPQHQTEANYPQDIAQTVMGAPNGIEKHAAFQAYLKCLAWIQSGDVSSTEFEQAYQEVRQHYEETHPITQEVEARLAGLKRKQEMLAKLKNRAGK